MENRQVIPFAQIQMLNKIGQGVYGKVYAALWQQQRVAIKKYKEKNSSISALQEEAALIVIDHKRIVRLLGTTTDTHNNKMLVMEFLPGGSLGDLLRQPNILLHRYEILRFAIDIAKGLQYLHEHHPKIVHRDLKPDNILLCANKKKAKITDFGCARLLLKTYTEACEGTMYYLAPEVADNQPYNEKADIYSFGSLLYTLLLPTKTLSMYEAGRKAQLQAIDDAELKQIISKCCNVTPKLRPSAAECVTMLKEIKHAPWKLIRNKINEWGRTWETGVHEEGIRSQIFNFNRTNNTKIPVRIFLSNPIPLSVGPFLKMISVFNSKAALFGLGRSGLQFGNVLIYWHTSSLVHIKELRSKSATISFEAMRDSLYIDYTPQLEKKVVDFIFDWNVNRKYKALSLNDHVFVASFMENILQTNVESTFNGPLGNIGQYLLYVLTMLAKYIKSFTSGEAAWWSALESTHHGKLMFHWNNHEDLDKFERERMEDALLPLSERKWNFTDVEIKLLKALHRGFQLRENYKGISTDCCYGPIETVVEVNDSQ